MRKKLIAILITLCSIFLICGLVACDVDDPKTSIPSGIVSQYSVELDLSEFSQDVGLNKKIEYENIKFRCTEINPQNGAEPQQFVIEAKEYMLLEGGETDTLGEKELVFLYDKQEFVVSYTVKYQVDFLAKGEVYASQFVLSADEIKGIPTPPAIEGYTFANYLDSEIPEEITENISLEVHFYDDSLKAPILTTEFEHDYEVDFNVSTSSIDLPSNENGKWVFVDPVSEITTAGTHLVSVQFIPSNDQVAPQFATITITVAPKTATFEVESETFVYDGLTHFPTFSVTDNVDVEVIGEPQISAGVYTYALLVNDSNYEGYYTGSFEIKKPDVMVTIAHKEMKFGESVPEIEYTVTGFENLQLLGIQTLNPNVNAIGNYSLEVIVTNTNVNATVLKGTLVVNKGDLELVSDPTLSTSLVPAVYENSLSTVTLDGDYRGVWAWKNPDLIIDSVDSFTATAVFTPNNTNYNQIEREVTFTNIDKRTLEITITQKDFVYTGEDFTILYEIEDGKQVLVEGNIIKSNAGSYETTLVINEEYYKGSEKVTLFIDKATPITDFTTEYNTKWTDDLVLSYFELPDGYTWDNPQTDLSESIKCDEYPATFTPSDTDNYYIIHDAFKVTVNKADGVLHGVKDFYEFVYNKTAHPLKGITSTPSDGEIKYTYMLNGEKVDSLLLPGTYEVIIDLVESTYHTSAQKIIEVLIVEVDDVVPSYTPSSTCYTGETISVVIGNSKGVNVIITSDNQDITISGNTVSVVKAGTYTVTLTMGEENVFLYKWHDQAEMVLSTTYSFTIDSAPNGLVEGVTLGDLLDNSNHVYENASFTTEYSGNASKVDLTKHDKWTKHGTPIITYCSDVNGVRTPLGENEYPTSAGTYYIKVFVQATSDYAEYSSEVKLVIEKAKTVITVPTYLTEQLQKDAESNKNGYNYTTEPKATLVSTGAEIAGTFTYGDIKFNKDGGANSTYTITFTPTNINHAVSTAEVTINLIDVAYRLVGNAREYYGSIENALASVTSGEILVVPNATANDIHYNVTIDSDITIPSGVTLVIPYGTKGNEVRNTSGKYINPDEKKDQVTEATIEDRESYVVVKSGVKITVDGTLELSGLLGSGCSGIEYYAGQTFDHYAELHLEPGATIEINKTAKITGFITGEGGNVITNSGSTIYLPFVYGDHRGGTYLTKVKDANNNASPFNRFQIRNIRNAKLTMKYNSVMKVYANLLNGVAEGHSENTFIGDNGIIKLLSSYSYLTAVFDPVTDKCDLNVYGHAESKYFKLTLKLSIFSTSVSSEDFDFPIPGYYNISLRKVEGVNDANNGNFTMQASYKLLPGSTFTVEKGATLTVNKMIIYTSIHTVITGDADRPYYNPEFANTPGKLTVNGTLIANFLGGAVYTQEKGAMLQVKSSAKVTVQEASEYNYSNKTVTYTPVTNSIYLKSATYSGEPYSSVGTYYSIGKDTWVTKDYTISYDFKGGNVILDNIAVIDGKNGYTLTSADIPTNLTRSHCTFSHWCLNSECNDYACEGVKVGDILYGDNTIYAIWIGHEYTLKFVNLLPDGTQVETQIPNAKFTVDSVIPLPGEPTSPNESYNFSGWFDQSGAQLANISGANFADEALANNGVAIVYGCWVNDIVYDVYFETNTDDIKFEDPIPVTTESYLSEQLSKNSSNLSTNNNTLDVETYFAGWFVDEALTIPYESFEQLKACASSGGKDNGRTIYAKWVDKIKITVSSNQKTSASDGTYSSAYTIKFSDTNSGYYAMVSKDNRDGNGTWYILPNHYVCVETESESVVNIEANTYTQVTADLSIEVNYDDTEECFTGDTLITLADGSQKRADELTLEDTLLVFNHETGAYEGAGIIFIENDGYANYNVIHLDFSDGTQTKLIYEHGYFDITLNKYVYVNENNFANFIGHEFAVLADNGYERVTLTNAYAKNEYTSCYSLVTVYHLNYFVDGLFSMPGGIEGLFNMFEYGDGLVYDYEAMMADIQTYGLYTYADFEAYLPYEVYLAFPAEYFKVSVGKGMITFEEILGYIEKYLVKNEVI
ncbi:MAG: InlB B-repeat-containing protein [Clostridia bacterium]|nr:InlB B-repeat-containing protein [Clostridia bacterium]